MGEDRWPGFRLHHWRIHWCWIAREPRAYSEVIAAWRTSCPRLTIWEDAADAGYVARKTIAGSGLVVTVTEGGQKLLREHGRVG
jgi:hypothetical protein